MRIYEHTLTCEKSDTLKTEILFTIASSKAIGFDLIIFTAKESLIKKITKVLRAAKVDNLIQLYALCSDFYKQTMETDYLINKFQDLQNLVKNREDFFIVLKI